MGSLPPAVIAAAAFVGFILLLADDVRAVELNYPAVFNFGDSNSDTGGLVAGLGERLELPNGMTHFHSPSGRFCDGRLIIDFLVDDLDIRPLNPYLDSIGAPNFRRGCNFAVAGSGITMGTGSIVSPFSLGIQVAQFSRFKARVLQLHATGKKWGRLIPNKLSFGQALYIMDIGQNDLASAFYSKSEDQVIASIPIILLKFEAEVKKLYNEGGRQFWIHNTGPLGCLAQNIAMFGKDPWDLDDFGCVLSHNRAARLFNFQLHVLCAKLQGELTDAKITYVDLFSIKSDLIANFSQYGFESSIMACCGFGGPPLNYDSQVTCGETRILNGSAATASRCNDVAKHVNWDGIHYTDAANLHVSLQILSDKFSYHLYT